VILVQSIEAGLEELAMRLDPLGLSLEAATPKLAGSHPSDLLRHDEPRPLQNLDVLLMPVSVIWNLSARLLIEASDRPR
jgi:hypothetical protein